MNTGQNTALSFNKCIKTVFTYLLYSYLGLWREPGRSLLWQSLLVLSSHSNRFWFELTCKSSGAMACLALLSAQFKDK